MKKIMIVLSAISLLGMQAFAQDREIKLNDLDSKNKVELSKPDASVQTNFTWAFPMYFGTTALMNANYKGAWAAIPGNFLEMRTVKNFVYGLEVCSLNVSLPNSPLSFSAGLRFFFMDFCLAHPELTFRNAGGTYMPVAILAENLTYDNNKSKIHADYLGIPLRISYKLGSNAKLFAGISAELLLDGYTKYKHPKFRQPNNALFNNFRSTLEAGFCYGLFGVFINYSLTPLFPDSLSDARTLSFGFMLDI